MSSPTTNQITNTSQVNGVTLTDVLNALRVTVGDGSGDMVRAVYDTDNDGKVDVANVADSAPWAGITGKPTLFPAQPYTHGHTVSEVTGLQDALDSKQETLVSGGNIKSINGVSILGVGDMVISSGSADHGGLTGLTDDDHTQYHNDARGDLRYAALAHGHSLASGIASGFMSSTSFNSLASIESRLVDFVNVKDPAYGAVGNGVANDTAAINACITANQGKLIYFPPGTYRYSGGAPDLTAGTKIVGAGRNTTKIMSITAAPASLFSCMGYGSGVESIGFDAEVTQTGGMYVYLGGIESYIEDFYMTKDFRGVVMLGNVAQIRHGRFQDSATNGIRIDAGGGDNSQTIFNVIMGAQTPANVATAGIRIRNSVALTIHNVSIIQQGSGLLIDPTVASGPVLNLMVSQCYFDNCTYPIRIIPDGGTVNRVYFTDVWASSGTSGVSLVPTNSGIVKGIHFTNLQCNLNSGAGVNIGATGVSELTFEGGNISGNLYGMYFNGGLTDVKISNVCIGAFDNFAGNTTAGITFGGGGSYLRIRVINNNLVGNGAAIQNESSLSSGSLVSQNTGSLGQEKTITVGASPFSYTTTTRPETVYVKGGTVSSIAIDGVTHFTATNTSVLVRPGTTVIVTYSSAPTMTASVHN